MTERMSILNVRPPSQNWRDEFAEVFGRTGEHLYKYQEMGRIFKNRGGET